MVFDSGPAIDSKAPIASAQDVSSRVSACVHALVDDHYCLGKLTIDAVETAISRRRIAGKDIDAVWEGLRQHQISVQASAESADQECRLVAIPKCLTDDDRFPMPTLHLLKAEEEVELARRYNAGRHLLEHPGHDLSDLERVRAGRSRDAHALLAISNLRLVYSYASAIESRSPLPFDDLVQSGVLGLLRAIEKYEPERGYRFSTYATWWIRQSVTRAVETLGRTIRIPVHRVRELDELSKRRRRLAFMLNRRPTVQELADDLGFDRSEVSLLLQIERDATAFSTIARKPDGRRLLETISDPKPSRHGDPQQEAMNQELRGMLTEAIATLPKRTAHVIRERFGLDGASPKTLEEIAQELDITRERVRQIQVAGLESLRRPHRSERLEVYLSNQASEDD